MFDNLRNTVKFSESYSKYERVINYLKQTYSRKYTIYLYSYTETQILVYPVFMRGREWRGEGGIDCRGRG